MIDLVHYTKLVGFRTIHALAEDNEIDTVYVRFANENEDRMFDCTEPTQMLHLRDIIASRSPLVVGWRLHHNHRDDQNEKAAKELSKQVKRDL